ncbi:MAG: DUF4249 domain-containing protein [Saprospiraceae bacterium]
MPFLTERIRFCTRTLIVGLAVVSAFARCASDPEDIVLPDYQPQPVVECYIEPGKPMTLLLTQSSPFFAPFDTSRDYLQQATFIQHALVVVRHGDNLDTLANRDYQDPLTRKFYNYHNPKIMEAAPGDPFELDITLPGGGKIHATAVMPEAVPFDSIVVQRSPDLNKYARVVAYFRDNPTANNYYHFLLNYGNLTDSLPRQDLVFSDELFQSEQVAMTSGYDLKKNATAFVTLFHISPEYHAFLESVQLALLSSQNPLSQPSPIKSNVHGSANPIGIFAGLAFDRDTVKVE